MSNDILLGKVLKNAETKISKNLPDLKISPDNFGQLVLVLGDAYENNGKLTKVLMEELSKQNETIICFDNRGILSSYGLIFPKLEPEEFAKWILLDSNEDLLDLQAIEMSSRFKESMQMFGIDKDTLEDYLHELSFVVLTPNSDNGINISNNILDVDFTKVKHFAKSIIFSLVSWLFNDDSISKYEEETNFIKLVFEFMRKFKLQVSDYPKAKAFLNELKENIDKFPGSKDIKLKIIDMFLKFIQDSAPSLFEGIPLDFKQIFSVYPKKKQVFIFSLNHLEDVFYKNFFVMKAFHQLFIYAIENPEKKISVFLNVLDEVLFFKEFYKAFSIIDDLKIKNIRLIISSNTFKNIPSLEWSSFNHIFISNTNSEILNNTISKQFNFPVSLTSEIKENQFIYINNGKLESLLAPRISYSFHRTLESFEISRLLKDELRDQYNSMYYRLADIKDKFPELQKKKIGILTIENGPYRGKDVIIDKDEIVLGRYEIYPQNKLVSRKHFKIHREGAHFVIIDNSVNGVFINGRRITQATLKERDTIVLGRNEVSLYFEEKEI
ncbi:MAG: FHA domain-containing protein [bacterium]|nr:FHA domain-containing protein [bacterium]